MAKPTRGGQRAQWWQWATTFGNNQPAQATPVAVDDEDEITEDEVAEAVEDTKDEVDNSPTPDDIVEDEAQLNHDDIDWDNRSFPQLSMQDYDQVYQDNRDSYYKNGNIHNAKKMYESPNAKSGMAYSYSQDMNHRLNTGQPLDADSKFMATYLTKGLHPIGKDCTLKRGAHDTVLNQVLNKMGINRTYDQLSQSQLQSALVGQQFQMKAFGSFGANDSKNPFIGGSQGGGREVIIVARTAASTKVITGARSQEEFVTGIGQNCKITDVKFTGGTVYPRVGGAKKEVYLYVDMW